jgi:extracellular factor (EF) 3-hydroxypalmitic acid methyl ester biosynthesis protein
LARRGGEESAIRAAARQRFATIRLQMSQWQDSSVAFQASDGQAVQARLLTMTRLLAVFELSALDAVMRVSEVFGEFRVTVRERAVYAGRAVVRNVMAAGAVTVCEVTLAEAGWTAPVFTREQLSNGRLGDEFREFMAAWQKVYRVEPEYKVITADLHTFLTDLRGWVEQVQMSVRSAGGGELETETARKLGAEVLPCLDVLFEKFERVADSLPADHVAAHRHYFRRQLHPLVLGAPFAHRTFFKPLGYAGDYEMVNLIARNQPEGDSLFAKLVNAWFVRQPPAEAHRNRITALAKNLLTETLRVTQNGGGARVCNLGCGPAWEVQAFLRQHALADRTHFTLVDFSDEALAHVRTVLEQIKRETGRRPGLELMKKSVHRLLKDADRQPALPREEQFDLVYCAGLFDYLSDPVCERLLQVLYGWLAPGGLLVAINVEPRNPLRHGMEHLLDWHLVYRNAAQLWKLKPAAVADDDARVTTDATGVNVFLEIRKPA